MIPLKPFYQIGLLKTLTLLAILMLLSGAILQAQDTELQTPLTEEAATEKPSTEESAPSWITPAMTTRLEGIKNGSEILAAIVKVNNNKHQRALRFLIENLQTVDLKRTSADDLISEVSLACKAREEMPWGSKIPDELFYNDVLPWFNVDEPREHWRSMLYEKSKAIVADCKTPTEAAMKLNERLFKDLGVKYSTKRKRANQAPSESIEQGKASCTGLSIILADACRSVCVPSRLAAIPSWPNKKGNHTWVEIWDQQWHFAGAAEPDPKGLNRGWFKKDAAGAIKDSSLNAIYAISFKKTDTVLPFAWSPQKGLKVYAINVTDRYTDQETETAQQQEPIPETAEVKTRIRLWNHDRSKRVAAEVSVSPAYSQTPATKPPVTGKTTGDNADMNNLLELPLLPATQYRLTVTHNSQKTIFPLRTGVDKTQLIELSLPRPRGEALTDEEASELETAIDDHFNTSLDDRKEFSQELNDLLLTKPAAVGEVVAKAWLESPAAKSFAENFENNIVTFEEHRSPYTVKKVGERPADGWPLVIAMHGGGGAPKRVNDSQWQMMQRYYKDHPEIGGYKYLALRAPNDKWNGFYDDYVYPLIENLIKQMAAHGDIDPSRVMLIGYSHGGYGAFSIGPKIPYRFSAIHASAAAPDGSTPLENLRNTRFTFHGRGKRHRARPNQTLPKIC